MASGGSSSRRRLASYPYLVSIAVVTLVTLVAALLQGADIRASIIPVYLVGVFVCSATTGRGPAVLCAVLSFLVFKFFFVPPIFSFTIDDPGDFVRLLTFLIPAIIGGGMAVRVREQALAAQQRASEMAALYDLSQAISIELTFDRIAALIVETTMRLLSCPTCWLLVREPDGALRVVASRGQGTVNGHLVEAPLRTTGDTLGVLRVALLDEQVPLPPESRRLLDTLASQAALALERSHLAQAAARAEALAESDRLKSTLLSAVSHDFRTPLASITAAADELIAEDVHWAPEARRDFGRVIQVEAERLNRLLTNLLDLSRLEAGAVRQQRGWYNIAEIAGVVLERLAAELQDRPVTVEVPDDLPLVPVDYVQIEQVLWNVLQNAIKYSSPGAPIHMTARAHGGALELCVADRGRGIPPAERERVFEKFYRVQTVDSPRVPGAGIGLSICKGLIEAHDGQISIEGREGEGTVVHIRLPVESISHDNREER